jgi:hypothetical protein
MDMESQTKAIKGYLEAGNSITGMVALDKFGCWSLPRRILDLKEQGVVIDSQFIKLENGKRIKEYWLSSE